MKITNNNSIKWSKYDPGDRVSVDGKPWVIVVKQSNNREFTTVKEVCSDNKPFVVRTDRLTTPSFSLMYLDHVYGEN